LNTLFFNYLLTYLHRRKKVTAQKVSLKKKTSPAIVPPTPDAPICQNIPSSSSHRENTTTEALAKDVVPNVTSAGGSEKIVLVGSSSGKEATAEGVADIPTWKKQVDALFHLDDLQEKASNPVSSAMTAFVQITSIVKKVCTPCSPRAPWRILQGNPS
jgi:hypothetical protein